MRPAIRLLSRLFVLFLFFAAVPAAAADRYAGDFLMLGAGARSLGMGEAFTAVTDGAVSTYYNPAGLTRLDVRELTLMHSEQFGGLESYNTLALGMPMGTGAIGVSLIHLGVGDIKYTRLWDPSQALSDSNRVEIASRENAADYALMLAGAHRFTDSLRGGATVKIIRRSIGDATAWGYGIDLGAQYDLSPNWIAGLTLRDVTGTTIAWDGYSDDRIASTADAGIAYRGAVPLIGGDIVIAASMPFFGDSPDVKGIATMNVGGEYLIGRYLALRAGASRGDGAFGVGIRQLPLIGATSLDYAFLSHDDLDSTHRVSLNIRY